MPAEAISLALAASIYPPAVAAVIALGRGTEVRLRVFLLVGAAMLTVFVTGAAMLLVFDELPVSGGHHRTASGTLEIAIGLVLLWLARRLKKKRDHSPPDKEPGSSKTDRYLESRRLVLVLGLILYVIPSPIYIGAVKAISDASASTSTELAYLAVVVVVMLWMVEVPMVMLLVLPDRSAVALERIHDWFVLHGRTLATALAAGAGVYLILAGTIKLLA